MITETKNRYIRLAREGIWIVIGQIAAVIGALGLVRVLTERLTPAEYGQLALGLTAAGLVNQAVMGGITNGIARFYSIASEKQELYSYFQASRQLMGYAIVVVASLGVVLMIGLLWLGYSQWMGLTVATLVFSVLSGCNSSLSSIQNAARQRAIVAFHGGIDPWLRILLALATMLWLGNSSTVVVISYIFSSIIVICSQLFFLRHRLSYQCKRCSNTPWLRQIWEYSWPFSIFGVFTWAQQSSDRWALEAFAHTHEVGLYSVLFQLGYTPISMALGMLMSFLGPILYQRSGDTTDSARNASVDRLAWWSTYCGLFLTLIAFVIALGFHGWVFNLLVASQYHSVSYLLPWVVLAGGFFAAGQVLSLKLMSDLQPTVMMKAKIITALLGMFLNILFASVAGLKGVVAALGAFSIAYFVWMAWLVIRNPLTLSDQQ